MTGEQKFQSVADQLARMQTALAFSIPMQIDCPYCGGKVEHGANLCCFKLAAAMNALTDAQEITAHLEMADEISSKN